MDTMNTVWNIMMAGGAPQEGGGGMGMLVPMLLIFAVFYFMLIRPQQRRERERRQMIDALRAGNRVVFAGGLMGTITAVNDTSFKIKLTENVEVEAVRGAVTRVLQDGETVGASDQG